MAKVIGEMGSDRAKKRRSAQKQVANKGRARKPADIDQGLLSAGFLVRRLWQIHVAMFLEATSGSNLTPVKFSILLVLRDHPNLDQVTLAGLVGIDRSNLAEILSRMIKDGLLKTAQSANDRRAKLVALTTRGLNIVEQYEKRVSQTHVRLLEDLSPNRQRAFKEMLNVIVTAKNDLGRARFTIHAPAT